MPAAQHLEFLIEEQSMEAFLKGLLPQVLPEDCTYDFYVFQGKEDLLRKLGNRLCGYSYDLPEEVRIFVVVDRDNDDCRALKDRLEKAAADAGLLTRSRCRDGAWQVVNRIAIEELEAWYFGDWEAVRQAYPRVLLNVPRKRGYRNPDSIQGGTSEAFERILKRAKYTRTKRSKTEAAEAIAPCIDPERNRSPSFSVFYSALTEATARR